MAAPLCTTHHRSGSGAHRSANGRVGNHFLLVRTFAIDLAFFTRGLDGRIARHAGDRADERNPAFAGFNFIQSQLNLGAGIAMFEAADVPFDGPCPWG